MKDFGCLFYTSLRDAELITAPPPALCKDSPEPNIFKFLQNILLINAKYSSIFIQKTPANIRLILLFLFVVKTYVGLRLFNGGLPL